MPRRARPKRVRRKHDGGGHRQHRDQQHRQVDGVALGHDGEHAPDGAGDLLFPVGDGMADQLGHAEGQHREIGAAQVQHQRAHHHRHAGGDAGAQHDGRGPALALDGQRAGVGADAEEGRGGQRQVARAAAEQAPAGGQRDVHQAGQCHRHHELAAVVGNGQRPAGEAEEHQQVAGKSWRSFIADQSAAAGHRRIDKAPAMEYRHTLGFGVNSSSRVAAHSHQAVRGNSTGLVGGLSRPPVSMPASSTR